MSHGYMKGEEEITAFVSAWKTWPLVMCGRQQRGLCVLILYERSGSFGFRDLASARQIAKLLADGVRLSEIIRGVSQIRK